MALDKLHFQENPVHALSRDPAKAMNEMMHAIDELRQVYEDETNALERIDTQAFVSLQSRKIETASKYESFVSQIVSRKDEIRVIDPTFRDRVIAKQEEFNQLTARNLKALDRLNRGVKRLSERIMNSARDTARTEAVNYGSHGKLNAYKGPVSLGISEQV
jgi:hypothetical protein